MEVGVARSENYNEGDHDGDESDCFALVCATSSRGKAVPNCRGMPSGKTGDAVFCVTLFHAKAAVPDPRCFPVSAEQALSRRCSSAFSSALRCFGVGAHTVYARCRDRAGSSCSARQFSGDYFHRKAFTPFLLSPECLQCGRLSGRITP